MQQSSSGSDPVVVDSDVLRAWPLRETAEGSSKNEHGAVTIVGGSHETPGGVLLAGTAALRSGAGRVTVATARSIAAPLAVAFPEARVIGVEETPSGALDATAASDAAADARCDALLIGTGATDAAATYELVRKLLPALGVSTSTVVDAAAIAPLAREPELVRPHKERAVVMPNPSEMAELLGVDVDWVDNHPGDALDRAIDLLGTIVALRGPETSIGDPDGKRFVDRSGPPALGTAGSGDVLAGILSGFLARGASPLAATIWAVHIHGLAGQRLVNGGGYAGILARDLVDALPHALNRAATMVCEASD